MHYLQEHLPVFFQSTNDLFDPFASPSLFFHNPGLNIPSSYNMSEDDAAWIEALTNPDAAPAVPEKAPRKSRLVFPPRKSTLKIPEALLRLPASAAALQQARAAQGGEALGELPGGAGSGAG